MRLSIILKKTVTASCIGRPMAHRQSKPMSTWGYDMARVDRSSFDTAQSVEHIWTTLGLPEEAAASLQLTGSGLGLPSSFKVGHLAQASIGLSALTAALIYSIRTDTQVPRVTVPLQHAAIEFKSERLYSLSGKSVGSPWGPIGGLHKTADGYVRVHDSFTNHRNGLLDLLGCKANRTEVGSEIAKWRSVDLESAAFDSKLVVPALRSYEQWDVLPQAEAVQEFPILIRKIADGPPGLHDHMAGLTTDKCLRGLRVLEMSRVIAAPLAGKTLAVHGADVLWVTSPNLPDMPIADRDMGRGKRTVQLALELADDKKTLLSLLKTADVFIQTYRPGSLASKGLSANELVENSKNGIICANMSAYGPFGPWSKNRGFDSLVQTCSGMNVSEAEHYGKGEPARPTPCQALDHAGGYFLATGIMAALYQQAIRGGSYEVNVSLAGVMKYLRSLGQFEGDSGFQCSDFDQPSDVPEELFETRQSGFGTLKAIKHSAVIDGVAVGWDVMPKPLGSDKAAWV